MTREIQGICTVVDPFVRRENGVLRASAALLNDTTWDVKTLPVYFMNGPDVYREQVRTHVKTWERYANVVFDFVDDPNALIRVSFEPPLSPQGQFNSVVGKQARWIPKNQSTVNLGFMPNTVAEEFQRLILHEFGHALGLIHEHQSPDAGINFKIPQVYEYFARFGWSAEMVQSNILHRYSRAEVSNDTVFDPLSIMLYQFPAEIADPPSGNNVDLSELDKRFIARMYPGVSSPSPIVAPPRVVEPKSNVDLPGIPLAIGDSPTPGCLVVAGGRILYRFQVETSGEYAMETQGDQAWILWLYDGADPSRPIASDDQGAGPGLNARIVRSLSPGAYYLAIAHMLPDGTGPFAVSVRAV